MTQDNPAAEPDPDRPAQPARQPDPNANKPAQPAPKRKKHWGRRIAIIFGALLLLLALLVALIPTIASTGAARSYVVKTINERLNGKSEIADWSLGWTSGIKADGIRIFDEQNRQILEIPHVSTEGLPPGAARGKYHLGKTVIDGLDFNAERYPDGTLNFAKLMKQTTPAAAPAPEKEKEAQPAPKSEAPTKLPDVDGDIQIVNCRGTVQTDSVDPNTGKLTGQMVKFTSIKGDVNIPNINEPITNSLEIVENTGGPDSGTVSMNGKLHIAKNNVMLAPDEMNVDQKLGIAAFELASVLGFCPPDITALAGKSDGSVNIHLAAHEAAVIDALLQTRNFKVGGPILKGDTYVADAVNITVPRTTVDMSPGLGSSDNYRIRVGPAGGKDAIALALANTVRGKASQSTVILTADITPGQLKKIQTSEAPSGDGMIHTAVDLDLAALAASVPHVLGLQPNVRLDSGRFTEGTDVRISTKKVDVQQSLAVKDVTGTDTAANKQIALQPIDLTLKATSLGGGGKIPDLRNIALVMTTGANGGYATANVTAPTLSNLDAKVHVALEQFQKEFSQFIDFGGLSLAGTMDLAAASKGNLIPEEAKPGEKLTADANLHLTFANLKVEGMKGRSPLNEPKIELVTTGTLGGGKDQFVQTLSNINTTLDTNDPSGLTVDTHFAGSVDLKQVKTEGPGVLEVKRIDLARLDAIVAGTPTTPGTKLTRGIARGTINFGAEGRQITVGGNLDLVEIAIAVPNAPGLNNEEMKLAFTMRADEDFSSATIPQADIAGSMMTAHAADIQLLLKEGQGKDAKSVPTLQMLRKAAITFDIPAVEKLQALLDSLSPPATAKPIAGSGTASAGRFGALFALANSNEKQPPANAPAAPTPPTKLAQGSLKGSLNVTGDGKQVIMQPIVSGKDLVLSKDGVKDPIGALEINGQLAIVSAPTAAAAPANAPSVMDQIASIQFTNLSALGVGSGIKINGGIEDFARARTMRNFTIDVTYNAGVIWQAMLPLMSKDSQESLKDVKVVGNYTRQFTLGGSMPADKPFNEAVKTLTAKGELLLDSLEHGGATITGFVFPITLSQGQARVAYADKPEGQNLPVPTHLNGGYLVLGGAIVNLAEEHPRLNILPGTKVLENVSLNPLFASTFLGDYVNNPIFVGANQASGLLTAIINKCERLPIDSTVTEPIPSNDGVLDMTITVQHIQIGNAMLANVSKQVGQVTGGGIDFPSLQGDIPSFTVKIQHGVVTQDLTLAFGQSKRPLHLFGDVALNTRQMHMTADFPWALFKVTPPKQLAAIMGDGVKLPLAGPVTQPQFNLVGMVQQNVQENLRKNLTNPQDAAGLLNDILGKNKKDQNNPNNPNQPSQQQGKDNPLDLLNNVFNEKDKNKNRPPDSQPSQ